MKVQAKLPFICAVRDAFGLMSFEWLTGAPCYVIEGPYGFYETVGDGWYPSVDFEESEEGAAVDNADEDAAAGEADAGENDRTAAIRLSAQLYEERRRGATGTSEWFHGPEGNRILRDELFARDVLPFFACALWPDEAAP